MSLYITRHGETDYNIKELVCGISEAMLSDKGIKQAQKLADLLRNIDSLYHIKYQNLKTKQN